MGEDDRKVEFLIRNNDILVRERFRAYRRFIKKALKRGFRRDLMRPVIARLRMFYGRHRETRSSDSDSVSNDDSKEEDKNNEDEESEDSYNNNDNDSDSDSDLFSKNRRVTTRSNNNRNSRTENKRVTRSSV